MAIQRIEGIKLNGSDKAFGGYIYNLSMENSFSESPVEVSINIFSEDGNYIEPELSVSQPYHLSIGPSFEGDFYAIEFTKDESANQKTMEIKFVDGSIMLDKLYVGLHKRHGARTDSHLPPTSQFCGAGAVNPIKPDNNVSNCLLIVGQEFHPCDINRNGKFDALDILANFKCGPCPDYNNTCCHSALIQILEVGYNFKQLCEAIRSMGIEMESVPETNDMYFAQYDGTIRKVLQDWGADYGFNFVWSNNKIYFIDATKPITIDIEPPLSRISKTTYTKSLRGTESRGSISYYQREGEEFQANCGSQQGEQLHLRCLTIEDIWGRDRDRITTSLWEQAICWAKYGKSLRDLFWYCDKNQGKIATAEEAKQFVGKSIERLGKMKFLKVIGAKDDGYQNVFKSFQNFLTTKGLSARANGYFIVTEVNQSLWSAQYQEEKNVADGFLGRFWIRPYNLLGTKKTRLASASFETGGDSARLCPAGEDIWNLPFFKFGVQNSSLVSQLASTTSSGQVSSSSQKKTLILLEKNAAWSPDVSETKKYQGLLDYANQSFMECPMNDLAILYSVGGATPPPPSAKEKPKQAAKDSRFPVYVDQNYMNVDDDSTSIKVFYIVPFDSGITFSKNVGRNPIDKEGKTEVSCGTVGLSSTTCGTVGLGGNYIMYSPSQGTVLGGAATGNSWPSTGNTGYKVCLNRNSSSEEKGYIPKMQSIMQSGIENCHKNTMAFSLNFRNIEDGDIRALTGLDCRPNTAILQELHQRFNKNLTFENDKPQEKKTYVLEGTLDLGRVVTPKDGLVGLSIRLGGDEGFVATYSFATKPPRPLSLNVVKRAVEMRSVTKGKSY